MREFLVEITTTIPEGTSQAEVDRRRAAEAVRSRELAATGHLARLWRPVGELRSIGIWRAADEAELHAKVLGTLAVSCAGSRIGGRGRSAASGSGPGRGRPASAPVSWRGRVGRP